MKNDELVTISSINGSDADVSCALLNATFRAHGDYIRFPDPDFGAWLIDVICERSELFATKRGVFRKNFFCPSCNTELDPTSITPRQIEYELQYKGLQPFTLHIHIPAGVCPQCKKISAMDVHGDSKFHIGEALLHAFDSAKIKP